jgi:hypothetical protein
MAVRICAVLLVTSACGGGFKQTMSQDNTTVVADKSLSETLHGVFVISEAAMNGLWDGAPTTPTPFELHDTVISGVERAFAASGYQVAARDAVLRDVQTSKTGVADAARFTHVCTTSKADGCVLLSNIDVRLQEFACADGAATKAMNRFTVSFDATVFGSTHWHARVDADSGLLVKGELGVWGTSGNREECAKLLAPASWSDGHVGVCVKDTADACAAAQRQVIEAAARSMIAKLKG